MTALAAHAPPQDLPRLGWVRVAGLMAPACPWEGPDNRRCILWADHPPIKSPSGPHAPDRPVPAPKPAHTVDPMARRA